MPIGSSTMGQFGASCNAASSKVSAASSGLPIPIHERVFAACVPVAFTDALICVELRNEETVAPAFPISTLPAIIPKDTPQFLKKATFLPTSATVNGPTLVLVAIPKVVAAALAWTSANVTVVLVTPVSVNVPLKKVSSPVNPVIVTELPIAQGTPPIKSGLPVNDTVATLPVTEAADVDSAVAQVMVGRPLVTEQKLLDRVFHGV